MFGPMLIWYVPTARCGAKSISYRNSELSIGRGLFTVTSCDMSEPFDPLKELMSVRVNVVGSTGSLNLTMTPLIGADDEVVVIPVIRGSGGLLRRMAKSPRP